MTERNPKHVLSENDSFYHHRANLRGVRHAGCLAHGRQHRGPSFLDPVRTIGRKATYRELYHLPFPFPFTLYWFWFWHWLLCLLHAKTHCSHLTPVSICRYQVTHSWKTKAALPSGGRSDMSATTVGDEIVLVGGCTGNQSYQGWGYGCEVVTAETVIYDPLKDTYVVCRLSFLLCTVHSTRADVFFLRFSLETTSKDK